MRWFMAVGNCAGFWLRGAALNYGGGTGCCIGAGSDITGALIWLRCLCLILALLTFLLHLYACMLSHSRSKVFLYVLFIHTHPLWFFVRYGNNPAIDSLLSSGSRDWVLGNGISWKRTPNFCVNIDGKYFKEGVMDTYLKFQD